MDEEPYDKKIICNCQSKNCCGLMNWIKNHFPSSVFV